MFLQSSRFLTGLVVLGVALRTWAYASGTAFWLDEILLSRNIVELPLRTLLTEPLRLDQVAPRGFLLVEKLVVLVAGDSELALRLFPFLCGIAGVFLFRRLAERVLDGLAIPFAMFLFAIGIPFIKYAAEVKQYELDASGAILLMLLALGLMERPASIRRLILVGLSGLILVWFSQASVLVMGGIGVALGCQWLATRDRESARILLWTMPIWALASLAAVAAGRQSMTPSTQQFMNEFWRRGFVPRPFASLAAVRWLPEQAMSAFSDATMLRYAWPGLFVALAVIGAVALWRTRRSAAGFILGPLALAVLAAAAQQYPLRGRLMLYLMPGLVLAMAAGAEWLRRRAGSLVPALGGMVLLALLGPPVAAILAAPPPYDLEHIPSVLGYLQSRRQPGDVVYTLPLHRIGLLYYGPRYGLPRDAWTTGICERVETAAYLRDVDRYRGARRLWVISTGVRPFLPARTAVRSYLSTIGVKRDSLSYPSLTWINTTLDLYDLSDTTRLRSANAATYPVTPMGTQPAPGCRSWGGPSPLDDSL